MLSLDVAQCTHGRLAASVPHSKDGLINQSIAVLKSLRLSEQMHVPVFRQMLSLSQK